MGLWHDVGVVGFGISGVGGEWRAMARDRAQCARSEGPNKGLRV